MPNSFLSAPSPDAAHLDSARREVRRRERAGLIISIGLIGVMLAGLVLGHLVTHHSYIEVIWISAAAAMLTAYLLIIFWYVYHDRYLSLMGYLCQLPAIFILVFLPYTWYTSVGGYANVPATYLMKTSLPIWAYVLIVFSGLALRPVYPLIITLAFVCIWAGIYVYVMHDPRTILTTDFVQNTFSPAIIPGYVNLYAMAAIFIGSALAWMTYSYRRSIYRAAQLQAVGNELSRYFSPEVRDSIVTQSISFAGRRVQAAVLFADIRGFTAMSEKKSAEEIMRFLRGYHERMVDVIYRYGGTVDKFLGDGIMVTFGTPLPAADDAERSVRCAIDMQRSLEEMNREQEISVQMGIGIDYGAVVSGNIGSHNRLEYTVLGDTVNTASRIEEATKQFQKKILFSASVREHLPAVMPVVEVAMLRLRGKSQESRLYTIAEKNV